MKAALQAACLVGLNIFLIVASRAQQPDLSTAARTALAVSSGTLHAKGLKQLVTVRRDRWGVPHIYAQNQHDLFFAQGFVAAQDRLFQMEMWKRAGQGSLAEVLGSAFVSRDINARALRYRGEKQAEYESYSPDTRAILEAFTAGINSYIASILGSEHPGLPIEFKLAGFKPTSWRPEDCLNRMAAFSMTNNAFAELLHAQLLSAVGLQKATSLLYLDPAVALDPSPGVDFSGLSASLLKDLIGSDSRIEFPARSKEGSNNWTVSGSMTKSGKPLVANDPHRVIGLPSLRYMVHLVAPGWDVIGAGEPGLPGVALGHNQRIAWGFTIFGLDQQDLYLEELNPANPLEYKTTAGWKRMVVEKESIPVKDASAVDVELKFTSHGPVLWIDGKRALALRWVGSEPGTAGYLGSLAIDRAGNWKEFETAAKRWKVPSENLVYGDTAGNIGEHSVGLSPVRKNWTGLLPVPGNGKYEWTGFVPYSALPHSLNPKSGFIVTANHKMIPESYPYKVGYEWAPPYRFQRITDLLKAARPAGAKLTPHDMGTIQSDVYSLPAHELIELLRVAAGTQPDTMATLLLKWNGVLDRNSAAAALYEVWLKALTSAVVKKAAPDSVQSLLADFPLPLVLRRLSKPTADFFGENPATARNALLLDTLRAASADLTKSQGPDPSQWSWGALHPVNFLHPLDQQPGAKPLFDLGPLPRPGDENVVNATGFWGGVTFAQTSGASYREILDTGDWDHSLAVNTPGQSGQPGSPHYSDLMNTWNEGQYFPLAYSKEAVERETTDRLVLMP
jgi:penicillin G amidase